MRTAGVLMPVSSLPGQYGIGTLGQGAFNFIDFLHRAGQKVWQILPLSPTGYGDSPYQSVSLFAGNPYYIDLDLLAQDGLLTAEECAECRTADRQVDYSALYQSRFAVLRKAFARFCVFYPQEYYQFCYEQKAWVEDYALFMTAKGLNGGKPYTQWADKAQRTHAPEAVAALYAEHEDEVHFWKFLQFAFYRQWGALKAYAAQRGVKILGDIPIYAAADSADVWAGGELFLLDKNGLPTAVAGCSPDAFSEDGQLWGNPLYCWQRHAEDGYAWWINRVKFALQIYDMVRIDHFRAFDTYYSIPYGSETARSGKWLEGPGMALFTALYNALGKNLPIVAEDLGDLFESVRVLLRQSGLPGMKVLQFAFGGGADNEYLPHNHVPNSVVYVGTHDNATCKEWLQTLPPHALRQATAYMRLTKAEGLVRGVLRTALASCADLCVLTMQDWLELDEQGRINTPGTLGGGNWRWRAQEAQFTPRLARRMAAQCALYGR